MQRVSRELERLLTVTALMTDSVIACDACGQMVYANFAAKTLFGEIDMEKNSMDDCPEALGIFDCHGERMLDPQELPLAQAAYEGKVVRVNLLVRQERSIFAGRGDGFSCARPQGPADWSDDGMPLPRRIPRAGTRDPSGVIF